MVDKWTKVHVRTYTHTQDNDEEEEGLEPCLCAEERGS